MRRMHQLLTGIGAATQCSVYGSFLSIEYMLSPTISLTIVQYICRMLYCFLRYCWYNIVLLGITWAQKSHLMIQFLTVLSQYFTVLILQHQYQVLDWSISESMCLKFSRCQTFDDQLSPAIVCIKHDLDSMQGILKGEVSLYH